MRGWRHNGPARRAASHGPGNRPVQPGSTGSGHPAFSSPISRGSASVCAAGAACFPAAAGRALPNSQRGERSAAAQAGLTRKISCLSFCSCCSVLPVTDRKAFTAWSAGGEGALRRAEALGSRRCAHLATSALRWAAGQGVPAGKQRTVTRQSSLLCPICS